MLFYSTIYLLQYHSILSFFGILLTLFTFIILYFNKSYSYSLCLLLLFSPIVDYGINIFTFKIFHVSVFYILFSILFLSNMFQNPNLKSKHLLIFVFLIIYTVYSLKNILEVKEFFQDSILLFAPFMLYISFNAKVNNDDFLIIFIQLLFVKLITTFVMYYFNITVTYDSNMFNRLVVDNSDEIGVLLKTFALSIFLFCD